MERLHYALELMGNSNNRDRRASTIMTMARSSSSSAFYGNIFTMAAVVPSLSSWAVKDGTLTSTTIYVIQQNGSTGAGERMLSFVVDSDAGFAKHSTNDNRHVVVFLMNLLMNTTIQCSRISFWRVPGLSSQSSSIQELT